MGDWFGVDLTDHYDPGDWHTVEQPVRAEDNLAFFFDELGRRQPVDHWSDLLFQSTWWQDADRNIWRLDELDDMRCSRIYGFVARLEDETGTHLAWEATRAPVPTADVAFDAYDRGMSQLLDMVSERGWIQRTELMVALQRRMRGLPAVDGECFCGYPLVDGWDHSACRAGIEIA